MEETLVELRRSRARRKPTKRARAEKREEILAAIAWVVMWVGIWAFFLFIFLTDPAYGMDWEHVSEFTASESVPMDDELQEYLFRKCELYGIDYEFALGTIELESHFDVNAEGYNPKSRTTDRGICQVNSSSIAKLKRMGFIESAQDLFEPHKCIDCGMYILWQCVDKFGNTEDAYYMYNTGNEHKGSNKASRLVWKYTQKWKRILDEERQRVTDV